MYYVHLRRYVIAISKRDATSREITFLGREWAWAVIISRPITVDQSVYHNWCQSTCDGDLCLTSSNYSRLKNNHRRPGEITGRGRRARSPHTGRDHRTRWPTAVRDHPGRDRRRPRSPVFIVIMLDRRPFWIWSSQFFSKCILSWNVTFCVYRLSLHVKVNTGR